MARTALCFLWATSSDLDWPLDQDLEKTWGCWATQPPTLLVPLKVFLEQKGYKDDSSWIKLEVISSFYFSFFVIFLSHRKYVIKASSSCPLPQYFFLPRDNHFTLFGICLCILNNTLFILPLTFSAPFLMSCYGNEIFISLSHIITFSSPFPSPWTISAGLFAYVSCFFLDSFYFFISYSVGGKKRRPSS